MRRPPSPPAPGTNVATTSAPEAGFGLRNRFTAALERLGFHGGAPAALAVSGGGDSMALMSLFAASDLASPPSILIVDHGLRPNAHREAAQVAGWAQALGFVPHVLRWTGDKPTTGLEEAARNARYRLLGDWCCQHQVGMLFVGHTEDDVAETFLMRLWRGSGVDGLAAMPEKSPYPLKGYEGLTVLRPLLKFRRTELRAYLAAQGTPWLEDPMNDDPRFLRSRIRALLPALNAAGLDVSRIVAAARHLARARESLETATAAFLAAYSRTAAGDVLLDRQALKQVPREIGLRALSAVLMQVSGAPYRPRFERLEALFEAATAEGFRKARTLLGCRLAPAPKGRAIYGTATLLIAKEPPRTAPKMRPEA